MTKPNLCLLFAIAGIATAGLTGCASDEVTTTTTTHTSETSVAHPAVTTETRTIEE